MQVYLVRHGQSRWQINKDNDWDSPLTDLGRTQAEQLSQWLANRPMLTPEMPLDVATIHASPYLRAQQTAAPIASTLDLPVTTDSALREASFLVSDHLPSVESPHHPFPAFDSTEIYATFKVQAKRALTALLKSAEDDGGPVMAISHGGLISTILRLIIGSDNVSFWIYNASLNLVEWKRGRWHLVYLNLWDHLVPELRTF
jgi:broad specificity phosphatase PhoE